MAQQRPNVLLFTTDQQRGDHISISGHPVIHTANVDAFVDNGAYFPNAYTEIRLGRNRGRGVRRLHPPLEAHR